MNRRLFVTATALWSTMSVSAFAQHVTAHTAGMAHVVDLTGDCSDVFTGGPLTLADGVVFSSTFEFASPCATFGPGGLGDNGVWYGINGPYASLNTNGDDQWMRFAFGGAVSDAGAFVNFAPGYGNPFIEALDASNNVIDFWGLGAINTPGGFDEGEFHGFAHASADIYALQFRDAFVVATDIEYSDVQQNIVSGAPEPASLALMATGLAGLCAARRRRKA